MPRLSIVIPCLEFDGRVEDTLVSVLQNRPDGSEVIVVTAGEYDDPYRLSDEVTFVREDAEASVLRLINRGILEASADVVHNILPGIIATDGWTDSVRGHFENPRVAAVSPTMMHARPNSLRISLGVQHRGYGTRRVVGRGIRFTSKSIRETSILGPMLQAGFYRRDVVTALGGFDECIGPTSADAELGLALRELGYVAAVDPDCHVVQSAAAIVSESVFQRARHSERLFRRYAAPGVSLFLLHALVSIADAMTSLLPHRMIVCLAGRLAACFESGLREQKNERLDRARAYLARKSESEGAATVRMDFSRRNARKPTVASPPARRRAA